MKKFFTLVAAALCAMNMAAKDYTGNMSVTVNEAVTTKLQNKSITVEKQDNGKYHLSVKNFMFGQINVGTIDLKDIEPIEGSTDALVDLEYNGDITIAKNEDGTGMFAGQTMKLDLSVAFTDQVMNADMNIEAKAMGQTIDVEFLSNGTQIPNSDMEEFHTAKAIVDYYDVPTEFTSQEPNHWHSFTTATGGLANAVQVNKQIDESTDVRPGSEGKKSAKITSAIVLGFQPANGTLTTGQLQAAGMTPEDPNNCAFLDLSNEAKDDNGDPFYTTIVTRPDAIKAWVKFVPGGEKADYEIKKLYAGTGEYSYNASVKAVITDGTRYQDPEDTSKEYKNIVGVAKQEIETKNGEWQEITVPFDYKTYAANNAETKAILVNFGTNATPGCASSNADKPDQLYVDDVELVYNNDMTSLKFKGEDTRFTETEDYDGYAMVKVEKDETTSLKDFEVETNGAGAYVVKTWEKNTENENLGWELHIYVIKADLSDTKEYCVSAGLGGFKPAEKETTGINNATTITLPSGVQAIYNLAGQQVSSMQKGQVYVVKYTNGETKKMIKK